MLSRRGVHVLFTAEDGEDCLAKLHALPAEALAWLLHSPHAAVFTDKSMPRMDGYQLSRRLRQLGMTTSILGVSGDALEEDQTAFVAAGASAVITKPCTAAKVDRGLEQLRLRLPLTAGVTRLPAGTGHLSTAAHKP
jgi:CheY-like chemotaxis protein